MSGIEQLQRDFNMDDLQMLQRAQVFHNGFVGDKAAFEAAFPALADPFAADMQTAIDTADAIPSGSEVASQIKYLTEQLDGKMPEARVLMQKLFTYSDWAWDSKAKTEQFGRLNYGKVKENHERMKEVLEQGHRNAIVPDNLAALTAAGMPATLPTEIETLMNEMDTLIQEQVDQYSAQKEKSRIRVEALNAVWAFIRKINQASKVVFVDNAAKLDFYLLYPGSSSSLSKVQGFTAVPNGTNVFDLSWQAVVGADNYEMEFASAPTGQPQTPWQVYNTLTSTAETFVGDPGFTYWFRVRARSNSGLTGAWSDTVLVEAS